MKRSNESVPRPLRDAPTIPLWSDSIAVERSESGFLILDARHRFGYPLSRNLSPSSDLLQRFRDPRKSPHIRIMEAVNDELLVEFLSEFGPLDAELISMDNVDLDEEMVNVRVRQSLKIAEELRNRFMNLQSLITALQSRCSAAELIRIGETVDELTVCSPSHDNTHEEIWNCQYAMADAHKRGRFDGVRVNGHAMVCHIFAQFPPRLVPFANGAIELPQRQKNSIMPELVHMLRLEYLKGQHIKQCENENCWHVFRVLRRDKRFCSEECSRPIRQRAYWKKRGSQIRRRRLARLKRLPRKK